MLTPQKVIGSILKSKLRFSLFKIIGKPGKDQIAEQRVLMLRIVFLIFFFRPIGIILMSLLFLCKRVSMNDPGAIVQNMGVQKEGIRYNDQPMGK